jgi:hypothetical protein
MKLSTFHAARSDGVGDIDTHWPAMGRSIGTTRAVNTVR